MDTTYDFRGWATKSDMLCSDGLTIAKNAFSECDGAKVPLVWNHRHADPSNVLGHAMLECRDGGVYAYGTFNNTEDGQRARELVQHGDITSLSICANNLTKRNNIVQHGMIREVSLVIAPANPGAMIDQVIYHSDGSVSVSEDEGIIYSGEPIEVAHSDDGAIMHSDDGEGGETVRDIFSTFTDEQKQAAYFVIGKTVEKARGEEVKHSDELFHSDGGKTLKQVFDTLNDKQKDALYYMVGLAGEIGEREGGESSGIKHSDDSGDGETVQDVIDSMNDKQKIVFYSLLDDAIHGELDDDEEDTDSMKHNIFDKTSDRDEILTHADQEEIIATAKLNSVGSLKTAMDIYAEKNPGVIQHGINSIETLFPEYHDVRPGAPEMLTTDQSWIGRVLSKVHKSPISRIRTRQADIRNIENLRAKGYKKGTKKGEVGNFNLIHRTTDPQTVYVKSKIDRDDIIDITDFDVVQYMYKIDRMNLNEELATAILIGDGREVGDAGKIAEDKIRPIWSDDELYTLHADVDIEGMRQTLQGTNTAAHFGDNYIYAEAVIQSLLYAREKYKGTGTPDFYCTPHLVNVMLLARDLNGRRIYDKVSDLTAALNVGEIITVEQFEGKERTTSDQKKKKLLGLMVNLSDYSLGATKGGEITHFTDFDIDFNQEKSLIETRVSGANTRVMSAIALEEDITE